MHIPAYFALTLTYTLFANTLLLNRCFNSPSVGDFFARARASAFFFADANFFFADANARARFRNAK